MSQKVEPSREQIEQRAYEIYLDRGREDGGDVEDWFAAEDQLRERAYDEGILHESESAEQAPGVEEFSAPLKRKSATAGFPVGSSS